MSTGDVAMLVARMRREFDEAFARPVDTVQYAPVPYVLARVGQIVAAVPADGLKAVAPCPTIVVVPTRAPALVGIAAHRGTVLGLYALDALMGLPRLETSARRWMLACADGETGILVDDVVGFARARADALRHDPGAAADAFVQAFLDVDEGSLPVLDPTVILERIRAIPPVRERAEKWPV